MRKIQSAITLFRSNLTVGYFLGIRDIRRSSKWTTILIIFIMTITFLNLVVVRGILIGLIEGVNIANRNLYSSHIIISTPTDKTEIDNSTYILNMLENIDAIQNFSYRYTGSARLEAGYKEIKRKDQKPDTVGATIAGIDPDKEDSVTNTSSRLIEGQFLKNDDIDQVVLGTNLLAKYQSAQAPGNQTLQEAGVGSKLRLTVNSKTREVTVKGIVKTKVGQIDSRVFITERQLRQMLNRDTFNVNEIALSLKQGTSEQTIKNILIANNADKTAIVQTALESRPQFVKDVEDTFNILGNVIGSIGLAVATISIFIVIFVNAITRRKYIGILKGIGVTEQAIELSYMIQSLFYALCGILIAAFLIFAIIKPYFNNNPIDFPFSDGILVAGIDDVFTRGLLLITATVIAGYIPARIVVKQHTLDAILGR